MCQGDRTIFKYFSKFTSNIFFLPSNIPFWQISTSSYVITNCKDNYTKQNHQRQLVRNGGKIPDVIIHKERFIVELFSSSLTKIDVLIRDC